MKRDRTNEYGKVWGRRINGGSISRLDRGYEKRSEKFDRFERRDSSRFILWGKVHTPIFIAGTKRNSTLAGRKGFDD